MSNLINHITPLTRGIIWFISEESPSNQYYADIDYLLDGLLTSNFASAKNLTSRLVIGENFGRSLYVMIVKEVKHQEIDSFISLIKKDLGKKMISQLLMRQIPLRNLKKNSRIFKLILKFFDYKEITLAFLKS